MMNTLLSPTMDVEMKKKILWNEYQIPMERGFVKEMDLMCNLSQWVLEMGKQQRNLELAEELLKEETVSDEVIMRVTNITKEKLDQLREQLVCMA